MLVVARLPPAAAGGGAEYEAGPAVVPVKPGADQHSASEPQLLEVAADFLEVLIVQLALQGGEQCPQPVGVELARVLAGDLPELAQPRDIGLQVTDRAGQVGRRVLVAAAVAP